MRIAVCVKQVPDTTEVKIDPKTGTLIREGVPSIINPFDQFAVEEAVRLRDAAGGGEVIAISMGPPQARSVLVHSMALGADRGVLLCDRGFAGADTWATALSLSLAIKKLGEFDLVLCGMQAIDGDTAQVGPELAQLLSLPQITYVDKVEIEGRKVVARRQLDEGYEVVEARMPALLTLMTPSDFVPTNPPFSKISRAQKKPLDTWGICDVGGDPEKLGLKGSFTTVTRVYTPPKREKAVMLEGTPTEIARKLADVLAKEGFV
ncbi:MAG: electron transfer flavoprotein subunit beta/FixA family protein [Thermoplasmata archaeon]